MPYKIDPVTGRQIRGFAAMDKDKARTIAASGGAAVPKEKRPYVKDHALAQSAGRAGGLASGESRRRRTRPRELSTEQPAPTLDTAHMDPEDNDQ